MLVITCPYIYHLITTRPFLIPFFEGFVLLWDVYYYWPCNEMPVHILLGIQCTISIKYLHITLYYIFLCFETALVKFVLTMPCLFLGCTVLTTYFKCVIHFFANKKDLFEGTVFTLFSCPFDLSFISPHVSILYFRPVVRFQLQHVLVQVTVGSIL